MSNGRGRPLKGTREGFLVGQTTKFAERHGGSLWGGWKRIWYEVGIAQPDERLATG